MKKLQIYAAVLFFAFATVSCSRKTVYQSAIADSVPDSRAMMSDVKKLSSKTFAASDIECNYNAEKAVGMSLLEKTSEVFERKLIQSGALNLEVHSIQEMGQAVERWCSQFGGYIESSYASETSGNTLVRVPCARFSDAMNEASGMGRLLSKSISTEDVSERFYDLQSRLETRKIMRTRLQGYLSQAKDTKDMLHIESELNRVISDIESMEGSMNRLAGQIDYSSISVDYRLPYRASSTSGLDALDFSNGFRRFVFNIADFFIGFVKIMLYAVIGGIPILAVIAFLYWLLLGKIGLLKKIFFKLNGKEKKSERQEL